METILALICERTAQHVQNRVLVANTSSSTVEERHGSIEVFRVAALARIGAVAVCPTMPFELAREERRRHRAARAESDGARRVFSCAPQGTSHRLVSQRRDSPELALPAVLSPVPPLRAVPRRTRSSCRRRRSGASAPELQDFQAKCTVIPFGIDGAESPMSRAQSLQRAAEIRRDANQPIVLFVGRLVAVQRRRRAARGADRV